MEVPESTLRGLESVPLERRARWGRRVVLSLMVTVVAAGGSGLLGVRSATTTVDSNGWHLAVEHAVVARAGLDVPWNVTVRHPGGFGPTITIAVTGDYFDIYETQGFHPDPSATRRDATTLYLTFDSPRGDTFVLSYDAYIQPSSQRGADATVGVVDGGVTVASVKISTHLLP